MNDADLFISTLDDLASRLAPGRGEYDVLKAAALVRALIIDGDKSIALRVNRRARLKIRYRLNAYQPPRDPAVGWWVVGDLLDPDVERANLPLIVGLATAHPGLSSYPGRGGPGLVLTLPLTYDQFMGYPIVVFMHNRLTVHDVFDYLAHVAGGVHRTDPASGKEEALAHLYARLRLGGLPTATHSFLAVGRIVLTALRPLRAYAEAHRDEF